jgi:hypothetical protein
MALLMRMATNAKILGEFTISRAEWRLLGGGIARFEASVTPLNASAMAFAQLLSGSTLLAPVLIFSLCRTLLHCRFFAFRVIILHLHSPHGVFKQTNC